MAALPRIGDADLAEMGRVPERPGTAGLKLESTVGDEPNGSAAPRVQRALDHVAGYSSYNGSIRDWQRHSPQFTPGQTFLGTGGFGLWLVITD
ncbi:MAG: hypothetical protein J2P47_09630 [Acetobacteraceae bacterium]|nr:hypothetical protein [Acetobacteraceae bacterium]